MTPKNVFVRFLSTMAVAVVGLLSFTGVAYGASVVDEESLIDLAKPVLDAVMEGRGYLAAAGALILLVAVARRFFKNVEFFQSDAGGTLLTFLGALGAAGVTALGAGQAPSLGLLWSALGVAAAASGGYTAIRRFLVKPILLPLRDKLPPWARWALDLILWFFDSRSDADKRARAAGDAAVASEPAAGLSGVVGESREIK